MSAKLSIVGTPIGNMEDVTLRGLRTLKEADIILCEDTRVTKKLLNRYDIKTKTLSYHQRSSVSRVDEILALFKEGKHVALVTDAGMPTISDHGGGLINYARSLTDLDVEVEVVPGPTALSTAVAYSGVIMKSFLFTGFLPHKKGRQTALREISESERPVLLYESSHRIEKLMHEFEKVIPKRKITITKELTKMHEEIITGLPSEILDIFNSHPEKKKGEFVVIASP
ncbi:MAG: 16S rRNA (cytidine(1402)-2'-O)-methyltransferase [Candidatus Vogelbacteria bacterium CG10_big_fil_rev_8_21_14_0_10_45_14]|uniref:Ribosomal RNA small subunit methyltransferase I n=1 Tax=Candidatus Vogelbacteria bacterium CG10_big_fil_rev_8_21_14_0_10_45_14 TaxID=1975042 RepID=A0A2H0RJI8_9BACT|nr:MAG: 16S rRNA (cytidine(1402)-2'-O)-methyltransferase [Candidatus Vogelbacteria bacterium CG10_big_fil_rev_8_21_14_0_10_45_14]